MRALDDFVTRARSQNSRHHDQHTRSLQSLSSTVNASYSNIETHFTSTYERVRGMGDEMSTQTASLQEALEPLEENLRQPLAGLRSNIQRTALQEYRPTGETPQKASYVYPTNLPRTNAHENLLATLRGAVVEHDTQSPTKSTTMIPVVFNDGPSISKIQLPSFRSSRSMSEVERPHTSGGLREIDANMMSMGTISTSASNEDNLLPQIPSFKKSVGAGGKLPVVKSAKKSVISLEGRENNINLSGSLLGQQSTGRRRSPRTG